MSVLLLYAYSSFYVQMDYTTLLLLLLETNGACYLTTNGYISGQVRFLRYTTDIIRCP